MRWLLLGVLVFAQVPAEPYPGQRNHEKPPEGWFCERFETAPDQAHTCWCSGMNHDPVCKKPDPVPDDPATDEDESQPQAPPEDPKCLVWCHRDHCTCKVLCKDSIHAH